MDRRSDAKDGHLQTLTGTLLLPAFSRLHAKHTADIVLFGIRRWSEPGSDRESEQRCSALQ